MDKNKIILSSIIFILLMPTLAFATSVQVIPPLDVTSGAEGGLFNLDYSINVNATVINKGWSGGEATLICKVTCGKNSWKHKKTINIDRNESQNVKFIFTEPTVNDEACVAEVTVKDSLF